jgi:hypothetical protein
LKIGALAKLAAGGLSFTPEQLPALLEALGVKLTLHDLSPGQLRPAFDSLVKAAVVPNATRIMLTGEMPDGCRAQVLMIVYDEQKDCIGPQLVVESGGQVLAAPGKSLNADSERSDRPTSLGKA